MVFIRAYRVGQERASSIQWNFVCLGKITREKMHNIAWEMNFLNECYYFIHRKCKTCMC
jgi:hypothetical protein